MKSVELNVRRVAAIFLAASVLGIFSFGGTDEAFCQTVEDVDFRRDIGPILADTCFKCHGPDQENRESGLRLDTRAGMLDDSGPVVPGDLDSSELYQRIISEDPDLIMPPPGSGRTLTQEQIKLFESWIEQGAEWENHWSLIPASKSKLPAKGRPDANGLTKNRTAIDRFILHRLKSEELGPSPEADRATLVRRLTLDLTGLPPSVELLDQYVGRDSTSWYEELVDELLATPQYGEHMARYWLDAARYGDTHGLHLDNYREMWLYRDWVVGAFNDNLSYRQFTIEQLAGDLLNDPTEKQLIASGFNRAHVTTNEGGSIDEEIYVRNVVDRVSTTGTVFMGMTIGCAQCHDHKFDPVTQKEFYQLFAFFNNLTDAAMDKNIKDPAPVINIYNDQQRQEMTRLEMESKTAGDTFSNSLANFVYVDPIKPGEALEISKSESADPIEFVWIEDELIPAGAKKEQQWKFVSADEGPVHSGERSRLLVSNGATDQHFFLGATTPLKVRMGDRLFAYVYLDPKDPPQQIMLQFNNGNWEHRVYWGKNSIEWGKSDSASRFRAGDLPESGKWIRLEVAAEDVGFKKLSAINGMAFTQFGGKAYWDSAGVVSNIEQARKFESLARWLAMAKEIKGEGLPKNVKDALNVPPSKQKEGQIKTIRDYFLTTVHVTARMKFSELKKAKDASEKKRIAFQNTIPTTLISRENETAKPAYVLIRGEYDQQGEVVERLTPLAMPPFGDELPRDRLGLARWLTSGDHPLTARVAVNRYWQQLFGTGIVKTSEDFGTQGEVPSHPELLDWLACEFVEHDWDIKWLMKEMVMSSTYRQSSATSENLNRRDPKNRLLARGPRFRLDAEMLRDQALSISDQLVSTIGGPGVKPPQPGGLWFAVGYSGSNTVRFKKDSGNEKVHRRSLYTFWKRTAPPPQMNIFDAPSREACSVRRDRTNTPLQALLLMNEIQYVESARHLAQKCAASNESDQEIAEAMFERAIGRPPDASTLSILLDALKENRSEFGQKIEEARKLVSIGESPAADDVDAVELASWTMIANLIMNMDEFVTKN